jgi:hypothetical protein
MMPEKLLRRHDTSKHFHGHRKSPARGISTHGTARLFPPRIGGDVR